MTRSWLVAVVAVLVSGGCSLEGRHFRADQRLQWVSPSGDDEVALPVELRWHADNFDGSFAVFIGKAPMAPGQTLDDLAPDGALCHRTGSCEDPEWLEQQDIFLTSTGSVTIDRLRERTRSGSHRDEKLVTVVLVDAENRRIGEGALVRHLLIDRSGDDERH